MTAEKKKFLVRGVFFNGQDVARITRVVKAHSARDAEEFLRKEIDPSMIIYSVGMMFDVDSQDVQPSSALVPWFGGYGIPE